MELHQTAVPTCRLKVNINCCTMCQFKAKEKLQKIKGVESVFWDSKGVVTVAGIVNPIAIVKKLEKWDKNAELLSFQKSPKQDDVRGTNKGSDHNSVQGTPKSCNKGSDNSVHNGSHPKVDKDSCCHCDAMPDSDSDDPDHNGDQHDDCKASAAKNINDPNIIWQKPDVLTINKQSKKSSSGWKTFLCLFCKKEKLDERKSGGTMLGKPSTKDGQSKWQFPRMHMPEYDGSKLYQQRPFEFYPPPVMERPSAPPYEPYGHMRPMPPHPPAVPPPYGFFNSRPPQKINPMIHYTSYADNYSFW